METEQLQFNASFFRRWLVASFWGWLIGFAVIVGLAVGIEAVGLPNTNLMIGFGIGAGVGFMQGRVAKKWFSATNNWMWTSTIGMTIPFLATEFVDLGFNPLALDVAVGGLLVGILQLRILKPYSVKATWWVPTCTIGWDGIMVQGIRELLSAVIRDLVYFDTEISQNLSTDLESQEGITNAVFEILRNAHTLNPAREPDVVVFWGGHSIERLEYDYTKKVGYETGLRKLNICTGCGPGAMKGPMKGATIAHAKQRVSDACYIGISEPGIIAAESPNPIVNQLVIMPDIEKRFAARRTCFVER